MHTHTHAHAHALICMPMHTRFLALARTRGPPPSPPPRSYGLDLFLLSIDEGITGYRWGSAQGLGERSPARASLAPQLLVDRVAAWPQPGERSHGPNPCWH